MKRNKYNLSNYHMTTFDAGFLVPINLMEVLPGDTVQQTTSALIRTIPLVAPAMHPTHIRIHHFFVPHRLVWDDWENFITQSTENRNEGGAVPEFGEHVPSTSPEFRAHTPGTGSDISMFNNSTLLKLPTVRLDRHHVTTGQTELQLWKHSLANFYGIPALTHDDDGLAEALRINALPFRGYQLIWNEYFRDQQVQSPLKIHTGYDSTEESPESFWNILRRVNWGRDRYTSCTHTDDGGDVRIPFDPLSLRLEGIGVNKGQTPSTDVAVHGSSGFDETYAKSLGGGNVHVKTDNDGKPDIDISGYSESTITDLKHAMALQRYAEARLRYGSRYTEYLRYLGVRSSDGRLQRPEYLGGGKQTLQFSEIVSTANTNQGDVGDLAGHGIAALKSNRYRRYFEEHGYVHSFASIRPMSLYEQGIPRDFEKGYLDEFYQKEFNNIGKDRISNNELYAHNPKPKDSFFGYQSRYDEYRRSINRVSGEFRAAGKDASAGEFRDWHLSRIFGNQPVLSDQFLQCKPNKRIFSHTGDPSHPFQAMFRNSIQARRMVGRAK